MANPTLGFPSRTAAAVALADAGLTDHEIAERLGLPYAAHARAYVTKGRFHRNRRRVMITGDAYAALAAAAAARSVPVGNLATQLIECIVSDNLVDAILDDREGSDA